MHRLAFIVSLITWPIRLPFQLVAWLIWRLGKKQRVLSISLEGTHPHRVQTRGVFSRQRDGISRRHLRHAIRDAIKDHRISGLQVRIGMLTVGWSGLYELRTLLAEAKAGGLTVDVLVVHPDHKTLFIASAADSVHLPPDAMVIATGLSAEMTFYKGALDRVGIEVDVVSAGAYKSAMEPFSRMEPSAANQEAVNALLDDLHGHLVAGIAAGRGIEAEAVQAVIDAAPLGPEAVVEAGVATHVTDEDEWTNDDAQSIAAYEGTPSALPTLPRRARLAVVAVRGSIRDGKHDDPMPTGATTRAVVDALDAARKSKRIKGILLHVDSPGGSATASERMWQAVRRAAADKPVVAWMGDYAASGGYYVASAAHTIVATPGTLTGSVGVFMAKPVIGGALEKLGLRQFRFERGAHAGVFSLSRGFSDSERVAFEGHIQRTYGLFLDRVCEGRDEKRDWIEPLAQGRVWTGAQAHERGMVDAVGTEADALAQLAEKAGVSLDRYPQTKTIERRKGWLSRLRPSLSAEALSAAALSAAGLPATLVDQLRMVEDGGTLAWCPIRVR